MTAPLPRSAPSEQGVDARGIAAFVDAIEAAPSVDPHSLMVLRHGSVVAEGWWAPYTAGRPHLLYSLSKSFTSTAAGLAAGEGLLDLDDTVLSHFPEIDADVGDARNRRMKLRHVAAMASGHAGDTIERARAEDPHDLVRGFLRIAPDAEPGTLFAYNQPCTFSLGAVVQRRSGQGLTEFLRARFLDKVGIGPVGWQRDASGRELGYSGLHAPTDAIARLGQFYLNGGAWNGEQILSTEWVAEATRSHVDNSMWENPDWQRGYGFQFWMSKVGYRGDGAYGQFCLVLPEHDAVVAITSATDDMQLVLDLVWAHLVPAMSDGAEVADTATEAALRARMEHLALPPVGGAAAASVAASWTDAEFTPGGDSAAAQPSLQAVRVRAGGGGPVLDLVEEGCVLSAPIGIGRWAVADPQGADGSAVPIAVSGGWTDSGPVADVIFLETPHRLRLKLDAAAGTFAATWLTAPLRGGPLAALHAPAPS